MKTLGRILVIVLALTIVMGMLYVAVNAASSRVPAQTPRFDRGERDRPEFSERERGERFERGAVGSILGAIKNIALIAIVVTMIVLPRGWLERQKRRPKLDGG